VTAAVAGPRPWLFALALGLAACRERYRPPAEAPPDVPGDARAVDAAADVPVDAREPVTGVRVAAESGEVRWDGAHRCDGAAPGGALGPDWRALQCGDRVETAAGASARFELPGENFVSLGGEGAAEVAGHVGAALVLLRGAAELSSPFEAARSLAVDTPAGRVIVSVGIARVAVAEDGAVRVTSVEGVVTVWAGRPFAARSIAPRASVRLTLPGGSPRGALARAAAFARAGAGDERDAREALGRLRAGLIGRDRDAAQGALSLALGRLHARARRARELAGPGDAGAALGAFEALRDASTGGAVGE
jgi:hypothetical protein